MTNLPASRELTAFWFSDAARPYWFDASPAFDNSVRERFQAVWPEAVAGALSGWEESPEGALALVLALDQAPRNMFRNDPRAFSTDAQARAAAGRALDRGFDLPLEPERRMFLYLPLMHNEDLADQERCLALMERRVGLPDPVLAARSHRDIIARFGRFPHRNAVLGRPSTPEEMRFLAEESPY